MNHTTSNHKTFLHSFITITERQVVYHKENSPCLVTKIVCDLSLWSITNMSLIDNGTFWHYRSEEMTVQTVLVLILNIKIRMVRLDIRCFRTFSVKVDILFFQVLPHLITIPQTTGSVGSVHSLWTDQQICCTELLGLELACNGHSLVSDTHQLMFGTELLVVEL